MSKDEKPKELTAAEKAELELQAQEKESAIAKADEEGLDIYRRKDKSLIRLNRFPATQAKAKELGWKIVE